MKRKAKRKAERLIKHLEEKYGKLADTLPKRGKKEGEEKH